MTIGTWLVGLFLLLVCAYCAGVLVGLFDDDPVESVAQQLTREGQALLAKERETWS